MGECCWRQKVVLPLRPVLPCWALQGRWEGQEAAVKWSLLCLVYGSFFKLNAENPFRGQRGISATFHSVSVLRAGELRVCRPTRYVSGKCLLHTPFTTFSWSMGFLFISAPWKIFPNPFSDFPVFSYAFCTNFRNPTGSKILDISWGILISADIFDKFVLINF